MRAVVDTNIVISGTILKRGAPFRILEARRNNEFGLVADIAQQREVLRVIERPKFTLRYDVTAADIHAVRVLFNNSQLVDASSYDLTVNVRDVTDRIILASALMAGTEYLVTGDNDLLVLSGHPEIGSLQLVTPAVFLAILDAAS